MITYQLLSKDGSSLDDSEVLSGRWHAYVEGFVSEAETPGVPSTKVRRPFLRRLVVNPSKPRSPPSLNIYNGAAHYRQQVSTRLCRDCDGNRSGVR
jgi:paired amphipathic helix protein Sin3a